MRIGVDGWVVGGLEITRKATCGMRNLCVAGRGGARWEWRLRWAIKRRGRDVGGREGGVEM